VTTEDIEPILLSQDLPPVEAALRLAIDRKYVRVGGERIQAAIRHLLRSEFGTARGER
jgi:hypothetical protein